MSDYETTRCLRHPKKKAKVHTGHIMLGPLSVLAGWCSSKCAEGEVFGPSLLNRTGCYGAWHPSYGLKEWTSEETE